MNLNSLLLLLNHQFKISVEPIHPVFSESAAFFLPHQLQYHDSDFCNTVKNGHLSECIENKRRSIEIASRGRRFSGCCPFGVWEYVQPVMFEEEMVAILYLGTRKSGSPSPETRQRLAAEATFLKNFILYEFALLQTYGKLEHRGESDDFLLHQADAFIQLYYYQNISLADTAAYCNCNPRRLARLLQQKTGRTFRQLLTDRRLEEAVQALRHQPSLSLAQCGWNSGFADSNYFSAVFHRRFGCSPREFRRRYQKKEFN